MKLSKLVSKKLLIAAALFVAVLALAIIVSRPAHNTPLAIKPPAAKPIIPAKTIAGVPVRLRIPEIGVDAAVDQMGLTASGDMQAPTGPKTVGWYKFGTDPGNAGSAVIDGHYGTWKDGEGSVFDNLNKLQKNDKLYVEDTNGMVITFAVRQYQIYTPEETVPAIFNSNDGKAHLNLITCEGTWNNAQKSYSNRLVIFADQEI